MTACDVICNHDLFYKIVSKRQYSCATLPVYVGKCLNLQPKDWVTTKVITKVFFFVLFLQMAY